MYHSVGPFDLREKSTNFSVEMEAMEWDLFQFVVLYSSVFFLAHCRAWYSQFWIFFVVVVVVFPTVNLHSHALVGVWYLLGCNGLGTWGSVFLFSLSVSLDFGLMYHYCLGKSWSSRCLSPVELFNENWLTCADTQDLCLLSAIDAFIYFFFSSFAADFFQVLQLIFIKVYLYSF